MSEAFDTIPSHVPGASITDVPSLNQINEFKRKASQYNAAFEYHIALGEKVRTRYPDLLPRWQRLFEEAQTVKNSIVEYMAKIDAMKDWLRNTANLGEVGILPAIVPIATWINAGVIAGALALITKKMADLYTFKKTIDERDKLISQGVDPATAADIANQTLTASDLFKNPTTKYIIIGGLLLLFISMRKG